MNPEPLRGPALRSALAAILARPVAELPTPEQTYGREVSSANGRKAAERLKGSVRAVAAAKIPHNRGTWDREAVATDLRGGMAIAEIAAKHGISDTAAKNLRRDLGLSPPPPVQVDAEAVLADLRAGMIMRDVAKKHGCGRSRVQRISDTAKYARGASA